MKISIPVIAIAACLTLSGVLSAQTEAPLPAEFTAAKAAYEKQLADTNAAKDAAQKAAALKYETVLTAAEARATKAGNLAATNAILLEKSAIASEALLPPGAPAGLPADIAAQRTAYIRELERIGKLTTPRIQTSAASYLRQLGALETKWKATNPTLVEQIAAEKAKVAAFGANAMAPTAASGKSIVVNGDFSAIEPSGLPSGWDTKGGKVVTEKGETFFRSEGPSCNQTIAVPPKAKTVRLSGKMRCGDFVVDRNETIQGIDIAVLAKGGTNNGGYLINNVVKGGSKTWRKVDVTKTIPAGTTQLHIGLTRWGAVSATVDYDDIELVFR